MTKSLGSLRISDLLRPKSLGERVNESVVPAVIEPAPDYAAMQRLVANPDAARIVRDERFHRVTTKT